MCAISRARLLAMSNTKQMPTKSTLRQDCLTSGKFFQSADLVILCHDSKDAFHSECSLMASLIRFLVRILTGISLQIVKFLSMSSLQNVKSSLVVRQIVV